MYQVNSAEVGSVLITVEKICTVYQLTSSVLAGEVGSVVLTVFDIGLEVQSVDLRTVHFTPSTHCSSLCEIQQIDFGIRFASGESVRALVRTSSVCCMLWLGFRVLFSVTLNTVQRPD